MRHNYLIRKILLIVLSLTFPGLRLLPAQSTTAGAYVPGVTYQTTNPNYFLPNPFYFEGRIDWNLLNITQPSNAWDYAQRGIHEQDDLNDPTDAIADYQQSISMNSLANGTCQIVTVAPATGNLTPPPCMFTVRLRLAGLLAPTQPQQAIDLYNQVLAIDPLRLGVHAAIAATYVEMAQAAPASTTGSAARADATPAMARARIATSDEVRAQTGTSGAALALYGLAVAEYKNELALSPVTAVETAATADTANNAHVHWALAEIYRVTDDPADEMAELDLYLAATKWHSDTYPWRIALAQARREQARRRALTAR